MRVVTDEAAVADALAQRAELCRWRHPVRNVAVERGPKKTTAQVDRVGDVAMWAWVDAKGDVLVSQAKPALLLKLDEGGELEPGDHFCFVHPKTDAVSDVTVEYAGVGNCCTDRARVARGDEKAVPDEEGMGDRAVPVAGAGDVELFEGQLNAERGRAVTSHGRAVVRSENPLRVVRDIASPTPPRLCIGIDDGIEMMLVSAPRGEDGEDAEAGARRTPTLLAHSATRAQEQCSNSFAAAFDAL